MINNHRLEYVNKFTYLGSIISLQGGAEEDIKTRLGKARSATVKSTAALEIHSVLPKDQTQNLPEQCPLCAPLRLRVLAHDTTRHQQTFRLPQLRKILKVYWPETISNTRLNQATKQQHICLILKKREGRHGLVMSTG